MTNCGPNDTAPPNRVNTSLQLGMVRWVMVIIMVSQPIGDWPS